MRGVLRPDYTDLAVVVGPNRRWVEEDYLDLQRAYPEVLLGYRIVLATVSEVAERRALRGTRPRKIVVLDGCSNDRWWFAALTEIKLHTYTSGAKVEYWHVHRARGIWRIA